MVRISIEGRRILLVCVVCFITFFVNNSVITPDIMESRNIVTAREMVYDGHWIVPTMNGELRFEKPPLPTWLTAVAEIISPDNLALQRGMSGLAALLLVFYFWHFARKILRMDPLVPMLLLCTCYNVILMGRTASWDIYCHAFMMGGIYHLASALNAPPRAWRHFLLAGFFTGLSILSKGPVSLYALFLPFLISYGYFSRPSLRGKVPALCIALLIAVAVGTWWYAYCYVVQGDSLSAVVQKESGSWINHNVRPWWYYWKFFLEAGVWSFLLLTAIFLPLADAKRRKSRNWLFALVWLLASLVLLSLLPEKKSRYLFPLLIPSAYLMGCLVIWWKETFRAEEVILPVDKYCFRANAFLIAFVVGLLPAAAWIFLYHPGYISFYSWLLFGILMLVFVFYLVRTAVWLNPMGLLWGVTLLFLTAECFFMPVLGKIINNPEMKSIAETRKMAELKEVPFYHLDTEALCIELVYAAHRCIRPVNTDLLHGKLPCVLLTHKPIGEVLSPDRLEGIDTLSVGRYDDNHRPKTSRFYNGSFIYHVTLLKAKDAVANNTESNPEQSK